jgi:predicted dinucleotide-binding enzyme
MVALAFAREALAAGHEVVLSRRRGRVSLSGKIVELGHGASAGTVEAAASLDYVLLAVPSDSVLPGERPQSISLTKCEL